MKPIKIISHPLILITAFSFILISGEHLGGFYLLHILLGLSHGAIHSVLAVAGIGIICFSYYRYKREFTYLIGPVLDIAGAMLMMLSLFLFFYRDKSQYNYSTFYQLVPQITLAVFMIVMFCFLITSVIRIRQVSANI